MTDLSDLLTSLGISPLLTGLVVGFFIGLLARGRGAGAKNRDKPRSTGTCRSEFGGQPRVTISVDGNSYELEGAQSAAVMDALHHGKKIEAIKTLRAATGVGLKDARDIAEALERERTTRPATDAHT